MQVYGSNMIFTSAAPSQQAHITSFPYQCKQLHFFLDNGKEEYPILISKEATADYYKFFKSSVCENTDKTNSQHESFDQDAY